MSAVAPDLRFRSFGELSREEHQLTWLVKEYWPHPSYGMKAGPEKSLKSWLDAYENVCVAAGLPLFGRFEVVTPGPVVVFSGEVADWLYRRRARHIGRSLGLTDAQINRLPIYVSDDRATTRSPEFQRALAHAFERYEPVKVSLDPLYSYHGADVEAGNVHAAAEVLNAVSDPAMAAGASLSVVNHFRKDTGGRLKLVDITQAGGREWVDSWVLVAHRERPDLQRNEFRLDLSVGSRHWGGRDWELDVSLGGFDADRFEYTGRATWELREPQGADARKEAELLTDLLALRSLDVGTVDAFAKLVDKSEEQASRRLRALVAAGMATRAKVGRAYVYSPAPAPDVVVV